MRTLAALLSLLLAGCGTVKTKTHAFWCIGACMHGEHEKDQKEKGEVPKDPAPVSEQTPTS